MPVLELLTNGTKACCFYSWKVKGVALNSGSVQFFLIKFANLIRNWSFSQLFFLLIDFIHSRFSFSSGKYGNQKLKYYLLFNNLSVKRILLSFYVIDNCSQSAKCNSYYIYLENMLIPELWPGIWDMLIGQARARCLCQDLGDGSSPVWPTWTENKE